MVDMKPFNFYPNPVKNLATVELTDQSAVHFDFRIYNMAGKLVLEQKNLVDSRFLIDCSHIPQGFYIAALSVGKAKTYQKIIIQ